MPAKKPIKKTKTTKARVAPIRKITKKPKFRTIGLAVILGLLIVVGYYVISSQAAGGPIYSFGSNGDVPVPMDVVGNANDDLVVYRPSNGHWYIQDTNSTTNREVGWGINGDKPFVFYPGKGLKAHLGIYRPSNATWYMKDSASGASYAVTFGNVGDTPLPGDYDGDGVTDLAVWRKYSGTPNGYWIVKSSRDGQVYQTVNNPSSTYGSNYPDALVSDQLRLGKTIALPSSGNNFGNFVYWRPETGTWKLRNLVGKSGQLSSVSAEKTISNWGQAGDLAFMGDFSRDGVDDLALFRPSDGFWRVKNGANLDSLAKGANTSFQYGTASDIPMAFYTSTNPSDQNAPRYASPAFFRPKSGRWYIAINLKAR